METISAPQHHRLPIARIARIAAAASAILIGLLAPGAAHATTATTPAPAPAGVIAEQLGGSTNLREGGAAAVVQYRLASAPTSNVLLTFSPDTQITLDHTSLTFTPSNWASNQPVAATAVDDTIVEASPHQGTYRTISSSADARYQGLAVAPIVAAITDNDVAPQGTALPDAGTPLGPNWTVALGALPDIAMSGSVTAAWNPGVGAPTGLTYGVRARVADDASDEFAATQLVAGTTKRVATVATPSDGKLICLRASAQDSTAATALSAERCVSVPRDDDTLDPSFGWAAKTDAAAYGGSVTVSSVRGATLTTTLRAKRIALIATTCPKCGSVSVLFAGHNYGVVSLRSPRLKHRVVIRLAALANVPLGALQIKALSARPTAIDGVAAWRT